MSSSCSKSDEELESPIKKLHLELPTVPCEHSNELLQDWLLKPLYQLETIDEYYDKSELVLTAAAGGDPFGSVPLYKNASKLIFVYFVYSPTCSSRLDQVG